MVARTSFVEQCGYFVRVGALRNWPDNLTGREVGLDSRFGLPTNTLLDGSYRIERVIGSGGFGVTYLAQDIALEIDVALKEYYPFEFGERVGPMSVRPRSERDVETFEWGRTRFLEEAQ